MRRISNLVSACALAACATLASAQDYPNHAVKVVVPFAAGGSGDIIGRIMGQHLGDVFKQPFVIENRVGAAGNIGAEAVAKSPPDGYTMLLLSSTNATNESLYPNKPFVLMRDLAAVAPLNYFDMVLVVPASLPVNNVQELIAYAKANPGKLNFASSGVGTNYHMAGELFKAMTKTDIVHVPYKLASNARADILNGQVQMMFDGIATQQGHIQAGKVKALATTGKTRSTVLPGVPTLDESGVKGYEVLAWNGVMVPAGTPPAVINRLNAEITKLASRADVKEAWAKQAVEPIVMTPQEFDKFIRAEIDKWAEVVRVSGAKVE